jgi:2-succinyl-6-hydroxy-2,4-cyclohexadiene-1-carboxylate synthase
MSLLGLQRVGSGQVLVWLHGFTQTKDSAHEFLSILAGTHQLLTIDLPGHGANAAVSASLDETADLLVDALPAEPFTLGGYSFGGRVALHVAQRHPERLSRLILLSATLGLQNDDERRARRERDEQLANHIEEIGVDAFLDEWLAQPMFAALTHDDVERRLRSRDAHGLATSLRLAGTGTQRWLGASLKEFNRPTLVLAGANDKKFVAEARRLQDALPEASSAFIADAGHAAHLEQPRLVAELVGDV